MYDGCVYLHVCVHIMSMYDVCVCVSMVCVCVCLCACVCESVCLLINTRDSFDLKYIILRSISMKTQSHLVCQCNYILMLFLLFLLFFSQVSFDVAWSPNCIDQRCYEYAELAMVTDYLVIMSYDERSQITGPCVAGPNSGYNTTLTGVLQYRALGLNTTRLILGVPWYGYNYPCLSISDDHVCSIEKVPFRGVDCSDAAGLYRLYYM